MAIKLTSGAAAGKKPGTVPSKQVMNFMRHQSSINPKRLIPVAVILVAVVVVVLKLGILNPLAEKNRAYASLAAVQDQLTSINLQLADYDTIANEYGRLSYGWMTDNEKSLVNRMDIVNLMEVKILPIAAVEDYAISDNVLTLNLHGITLDQASAMVNDLETSELVSSATVYRASAAEAEEASIFMSIVLTKEVAENE